MNDRKEAMTNAVNAVSEALSNIAGDHDTLIMVAAAGAVTATAAGRHIADTPLTRDQAIEAADGLALAFRHTCVAAYDADIAAKEPANELG